jgi:CMP-N,N'-diacetyllegionaminic acid synthase
LRVLALVPARGGSKRLPGKNLRRLGSRPLIVWSIDAARDVADICDILVSTDDEAIAEVARSAGALVPWLRPAELATDTASSVDVCLHALDRYEASFGRVDGLLLLQATSPFRSRGTVLRGIDLFRENMRRPVVGVRPAGSHPMWCYRIKEGTLRPFIAGVPSHLRSQDLPPAYEISGAFYLISPHSLRTSRAFIGDDTMPLVIDRQEESLDIDTDWDWRLAEAMLTLREVAAS